VGINYLISSLNGRVSQIDKQLDKELEEFFKSSTTTDKNFIIEGQDVWIIFNPEQERKLILVRPNPRMLSTDVKVLIFSSLSNQSVQNTILNKLPPNYCITYCLFPRSASVCGYGNVSTREFLM
jgi:hypothetical protein